MSALLDRESAVAAQSDSQSTAATPTFAVAGGSDEHTEESYSTLHERLLHYSRNLLEKSARVSGNTGAFRSLGQTEGVAGRGGAEGGIGAEPNDSDGVGGGSQANAEERCMKNISLSSLVGSRMGFTVAVWRRTAYRVGCFPLALSALRMGKTFISGIENGSESRSGGAAETMLEGTLPSAGVLAMDNDDLTLWYFSKAKSSSEEEAAEEKGKNGDEERMGKSNSGAHVHICCKLANSSKPFYLGTDLNLHSRDEFENLEERRNQGKQGGDQRNDILTWYVQLCSAPYRGLPGDIPVQIFKSKQRLRCLCSCRTSIHTESGSHGDVSDADGDEGGEDRGLLRLLEEGERSTRDRFGRFKWNVVWECIPDSEESLERAVAVTGGEEFFKYLDTAMDPFSPLSKRGDIDFGFGGAS